jgi:hypothetical protein
MWRETGERTMGRVPLAFRKLSHHMRLYHIPYRGDVIARDSSDTLAVDARVESGCKAFGLPLVRFVAASLPPRRST